MLGAVFLRRVKFRSHLEAVSSEQGFVAEFGTSPVFLPGDRELEHGQNILQVPHTCSFNA